MYIIKPHFDYCPIQKTEYFVNVKYKISDVNTIIKDHLRSFLLFKWSFCVLRFNQQVKKTVREIFLKIRYESWCNMEW